MMTPVQICAWQRRIAAVHEAGHFVVARHLGHRVNYCYICPNDAFTGNWKEEKSWIGHTGLWEKVHPKPVEERMIGIAGAFAVMHLINKKDPIFDAETFFDVADISLSDWELAGCDPREPDRLCFKAHDRLEKLLPPEAGGLLWPKLTRVARALIIASRTNEQADLS